jgi:hypothetical protein
VIVPRAAVFLVSFLDNPLSEHILRRSSDSTDEHEHQPPAPSQTPFTIVSSFEADQTSQNSIRLKLWLERDVQQNYCFFLDWIPERIEGGFG